MIEQYLSTTTVSLDGEDHQLYSVPVDNRLVVTRLIFTDPNTNLGNGDPTAFYLRSLDGPDYALAEIPVPAALTVAKALQVLVGTGAARHISNQNATILIASDSGWGFGVAATVKVHLFGILLSND